MAIDLSAEYTGRVDTSDPTGYPYGAIQNESVPGADDGTPSDSKWGNDLVGFQQSLLSRASLPPSGTPDKVGASQLSDALDVLYTLKDDTRIPTQDENDALAGTDGTPSGTNGYVTDSDPRVPTQNENDAMVGTFGAPSSGNRYVVEEDPAMLPTDLAQVLYRALSTGALYYVREEQPSASDAGGSVAGTWNVRELNTVSQGNIVGASLSSSTITLPQGEYWVNFSGPAVGLTGGSTSQNHQTRLRDITNGGTLVVGSSEAISPSTSDVTQTRSRGAGKIILADATTEIQLQHYTSATKGTNGLGCGLDNGEINVFGELEIYELQNPISV